MKRSFHTNRLFMLFGFRILLLLSITKMARNISTYASRRGPGRSVWAVDPVSALAVDIRDPVEWLLGNQWRYDSKYQVHTSCELCYNHVTWFKTATLFTLKPFYPSCPKEVWAERVKYLCMVECALTRSGLMVGREGSKRLASLRRVEMSVWGRRVFRWWRYWGMMEGWRKRGRENKPFLQGQMHSRGTTMYLLWPSLV